MDATSAVPLMGEMMMSKQCQSNRRLAFALAIVLATSMLMAGSALAAPQTHRQTVHVTLQEFAITVTPAPHAGRVSFVIKNDGKAPHEFVMFATKLDSGSLPLDKDGNMNEDAPGLKAVADTGSNLKPGTHRTIHATLKPGHYVGVCNLTGHYGAGMSIDITVR